MRTHAQFISDTGDGVPRHFRPCSLKSPTRTCGSHPFRFHCFTPACTDRHGTAPPLWVPTIWMVAIASFCNVYLSPCVSAPPLPLARWCLSGRLARVAP